MQKPRILLVDDDAAFCAELVEGLRYIFDFRLSHSKFEAVSILKKENIDLVLLDLHIDEPNKIDGFDLLAELRQIVSDLPIIIISTEDKASIVRDSLIQYRAQDYIVKGEPFEEIHQKIRENLKKPLVFISYAVNDKLFVHLLVEKLKDEIANCWIDYREIKVGENIHDEIAEGIIKSDCFLVVLSKNSVESKWVKREMAFAREEGKYLMPIIYGRFDMPKPIKLMLSDLHYISFENIFEEEIRQIQKRLSINGMKQK